MPHIEGSSSVTLPGMMGGSFQTTLGKIGKAIKSLFTAKTEASTQHRVVDGGNGNYTLMRKGRGGGMRLDMIGRKPEPTRTVSSQGSGSTSPSRTTTGVHGSSGTTTSSGSGVPSSSHASGGDPAKDKVDAYFANRDTRQQNVNDRLVDYRTAKDAHDRQRPNSKAAMTAASTMELRRADAAKAIIGELGQVGGAKKALATAGGLSDLERGAHAKTLDEDRAKLNRQLVTTRLPGVGRLLNDVAGTLSPDRLRQTRSLISNATGMGINKLALRAETTAIARDPFKYMSPQHATTLVGSPARFLERMDTALGKLSDKGMLDPVLMARISDFGRMREWSEPVDTQADAAAQQKQALRNYDAAHDLLNMLESIAAGDAGMVDMLMGKDHALDDYALQLKLKMGEGQPGYDADRITAEHQLNRAERTVKELLVAEVRDGSKTRVDKVFDERGQGLIAIDHRLLQALRTRHEKADLQGGDSVGRDINMLLAHAMLLRKRLEADDAPVVRQQATAVRDTARQALDDACGLNADKLASLGVTDSGGLVGDALAMDRLAAIRQASGIRAGLAYLDDPAALERASQRLGPDQLTDLQDQRTGERARLEAELAKLDTVLKPLFGGERPSADQIRAWSPLASAAGDFTTAQLEVDRLAELDARSPGQKLGLDAQDLRAMGLKDDHIAKLMADPRAFDAELGGLARQGLRNSDEIRSANDAMRRAQDKLLSKGLAHDRLRESGQQFPEMRAKLYTTLVLQSLMGVKDGKPVDPSDPALAARMKELATAFHAPHGGQTTPDIMRAIRELGAAYDRETTEIAKLHSRLAVLPKQVTAANELIKHYKDNAGLPARVGPNRSQDFELAKTLLDAQATVKLLVEKSKTPRLADANQAEIRELKAKLTADLRKLQKAEGTALGQFMFGGTAPRTVQQLMAVSQDAERLADAIVTVRSAPDQKKALMRQMENRSAELDKILSARQEIMVGRDGEQSGVAIRHAVRTAVLLEREAQHAQGATFDALQARDAIEARLAGWGIDSTYHKPEIDDVLLTTIDQREIDTWLEDARREIGGAKLKATGAPTLLDQAMSTVHSHFSDNVGIDEATRQTVKGIASSMKVGDAVMVAQGDGFKLDTWKIPVEASGTIRARLELSLGARTMFEISRTSEGYELAFKGGMEGKGKVGISFNVMNVLDATGSVGMGGKGLSGAMVRFADEASLQRFLDKLLSGDEVRPTDWHEAEESAVIQEKSFSLELEAEAYTSTDMLTDGLPYFSDGQNAGLKQALNPSTTVGYLDFSVYASASAKLAYEGEWTRSTEENVSHRKVEKEKVWEVSLTGSVGINVGMPTLGDAIGEGIMERTGALNRMDDAFNSLPTPFKEDGVGDVRGGDGPTITARDEHVVNPFTPATELVGLSVKVGSVPVTDIESVTVLTDGQLAEDGVEHRLEFSLYGKATAKDLTKYVPDGLKGPLEDIVAKNGKFAQGIQDLLVQAQSGDRLSISFTLKPEIRDVINGHVREMRELRAEVARLERAGFRQGTPEQNAAAERRRDEAKTRADRLEGEIQRLQNATENFAPSEVVLSSSSSERRDMDLLGVSPLKWTRFSEGGTDRQKASVSVPGGAAERAERRHAEHEHGHGPGGQGVHGGPPPGGHSPTISSSSVSSSPPLDSGGLPLSTSLPPPTDSHGSVSSSQVGSTDDPPRIDAPPSGELSSSPKTTVPSSGEKVSDGPPTEGTSGVSLSGGVQAPRDDVRQAPSEDRIKELVRVDPQRLRTPLPVGGRDEFYFEPQSGHSCTVHALNAAFGGQATSIGQFSRWLAERGGPSMGMDDQQVRALRLDQSSAGVSPDVLKLYMDDLHMAGHIPGAPPIVTVIDPNSVRPSPLDAPEARSFDSGGLPLTRDPRDPTGDRCVLYQSRPGQHYVAFRKDSDDQWRMLDSARHPQHRLQQLNEQVASLETVQSSLSPEQASFVKIVKATLGAAAKDGLPAVLDTLKTLHGEATKLGILTEPLHNLIDSIERPELNVSPSAYMRLTASSTPGQIFFMFEPGSRIDQQPELDAFRVPQFHDALAV